MYEQKEAVTTAEFLLLPHSSPRRALNTSQILEAQGESFILNFTDKGLQDMPWMPYIDGTQVRACHSDNSWIFDRCVKDNWPTARPHSGGKLQPRAGHAGFRGERDAKLPVPHTRVHYFARVRRARSTILWSGSRSLSLSLYIYL
jgi:hypothetical protein